MNGAAFWEFKKKIDGPKENKMCSFRNGDGKIIENVQEIKREFEQYYEDLFKEEEAGAEEERTVKETNGMVKKWILSKIVKEKGVKKTSKMEFENVIRGLKNKKTRDRDELSNNMLKYMGKDMRESMKILINEMEENIDIPEEWNKMEILSVNKSKGKKMSLDNRRGLFITNTVSKVFERLRLGKMEEMLESKMSRFQCGGMKGRSITDHLITLNAVIDYNKYLGMPTFIWFGDAVKCFDKLNLEDCTKELGKIVGWTEAALIYELNKKGRAIVDTPVGKTREIEINGRVKQGTIFGPKLCSITTDRVNSICQKSFTLIRDVEIEALIYVDDIMFPSSRKEGVEVAISNCNSMEKLKQFTFSTKPEKSGVLIIGNKKMKEEQVEGNVKIGIVQRVSQYEYLGEDT